MAAWDTRDRRVRVDTRESRALGGTRGRDVRQGGHERSSAAAWDVHMEGGGEGYVKSNSDK